MSKKVSRMHVQEICKSLGGDYDNDSQSCDIPMDDPKTPGSVLGKGMLPFFILQVIVGTASTVVVTFFRNVRFPVTWWTTFLLLAIVIIISILMYWYKLGSWSEALIRTSISLLTIYTFAIIFGVIYEWNLVIYFDLVELSRFPTAATIGATIVSALLSFVLIPPNDRKDDDSLNDFSGGATLSIFENT